MYDMGKLNLKKFMFSVYGFLFAVSVIVGLVMATIILSLLPISYPLYLLLVLILTMWTKKPDAFMSNVGWLLGSAIPKIDYGLAAIVGTVMVVWIFFIPMVNRRALIQMLAGTWATDVDGYRAVFGEGPTDYLKEGREKDE